MKIKPIALSASLGLFVVLAGCQTVKPKPQPPATAGTEKKATTKDTPPEDDLDEYATVEISDPLEPVNRGTFWFNHQLYRFVLRPLSKTYETIVPKPARTGIYNVFDNVEYPVRAVNYTLQGDLKRAVQETGKFAVNSTAGIGGIMRPSEKIPALADVPDTDTGLTFAKWGIGHGPYLVVPLIGPRSSRDTVGLAGDYAMNPITWIGFFYGSWAWTIPVSAGDTIAVMPDKLGQYDTASKNAVDPYLAVRSAYVQYRAEAARKLSAKPAKEKTPERKGSITVQPSAK